jgi:hypothetical protein
MTTKVHVFFYGSYMNPKVLAEARLAPDRFDVASLHGYDIRIAPRANLIPAPGCSVYGLLTHATHDELSRLYAHAKDVLGETYLPYPVVVQTDDALVPALCYIATAMEARPADPAYVERIVGPAREHGFPGWYIERLQSCGGGS